MIHKKASRRMVAIYVVGIALVACVHAPGWAETDSVAALVHAGLPGEDPQLVAALATELGTAGYRVVEFDADGLCDPARLKADAVDLLVLPNAASLPVGSVATIKTFLEGGGDIIALNAPLWQSLLIRVNGAWITRDEYERQTAAEPPEHVLFNFAPEDIANWQRNYFPADAKATYETVDEGPAQDRRSLHAKIENLTNWDNFGPVEIAQPFPEGHTLTVFAAKGGPSTRSLAVEWREKDGSRWIAAVPLSTEWRRYVLTPEDFKFWESVPARASDVFRPQNATSMNIGMAFTHTGYTGGAHEFWVSGFGTASVKPDLKDLLAKPAIPALDTLSPGYKFFDCTGVTEIDDWPHDALLKIIDLSAYRDRAPMPSSLKGTQPRPSGAGFDKGRTWRWIPMFEVTTQAREWRGNPAALIVHSGGPFKGGQWAGVGFDGSCPILSKGRTEQTREAWYTYGGAEAFLGSVLWQMRRGVHIVDGGANFFTYLPGQKVELGMRVANVGREQLAQANARISVSNLDTNGEVFRKDWPLSIGAGTEATIRETWDPSSWPKSGFKVYIELESGEIGEGLTHKIQVWTPKEKKSFITIKDGHFELDGKRWRAHGVNYMPSSGIGAEDGEYFEQWLSAQSYDPEIIHRDLEHVKDLGLNAVSVFIYEKSIASQNLLDFLRQADELGLKVNLSLRPGTIGDFNWPGMQAIIEYYRLWEHDEIFAYDIDWEPMWLTHKDRVKWDHHWEAWIVERYGSIENAEKDWKFAVPRDAGGAVTNPEDMQLGGDGEWLAMAAAYRRFLDTLLYKEYSGIRAKIRAIDPNHFVSFRMTEAGDPTMNWGGVLPYDFPYLAAAVDILEPEAYGRIGDWEKIKPGWFEHEYARWAAPNKPMFWAEAGLHAWDVAAGMATPELLKRQGQFYRDFYRMMISSGADGIFWWWYPGGFRYGENSDYGIINCDGTDRDSSKVIRENTQAFLDGPDAKPVDHWIEFDRDAHPNGIVGVYDAVKDEFWKAIEEGKTPGLRTAGTGTNSGNCPMIAVGNTPCSGTNPPKYLDGVFDAVEVQDKLGRWTRVEKGERIEVGSIMPVRARVTATNLGEAEWVHAGPGAVFITAGDERATLDKPVPHMGSVAAKEIMLAPEGVKAPTTVAISLLAEGRTPFGEKYAVTLAP